jgi:hypothetical protein
MTKSLKTLLTTLVSNAIKKGRLTAGADLNDYKGIYNSGLYEITNGVANTPQAWTWLIVIGGTGTAQIVVGQNVIYVRCYTGTPLAWTVWRKITLTT